MFKHGTVLLILLAMTSLVMAQNAPIDFEDGGFGADWTWTTFENDANPAVEIIANPDPTGANQSATVAQFTALQAGQPWAGFESLHGADIGPFSFDASNATVKVMVWKSVISDVGIKFAEASGEAQPEVKVANTVTNEWEEITFDLSGSIGAGITGIVDQIIIFPDFDLGGRTQDNVVYIDNVTFGGQETVEPPTVAAPTPTTPAEGVFSIFSDAYDDLAETNFNPDWGQSTVVSFEDIEGNAAMKYSNLNYQGTNLGGAEGVDQHVEGFGFIHLDYYSTNASALNFFLISRNGEFGYPLPVMNGEWASVDIPTTYFADNGVTLADIFQFKVDGGDGTTEVWFDNWYFHGQEMVIEDPTVAAPTPTHPAEEVFSIWSSAYDDLAETNFNPDWGQSTVVSEEFIGGVPTILYTNLNYQGTNLGGPEGVGQDVSGYEFLHVDFYTTNATALNFSLISLNDPEQAFALPVALGEWVSVDIPLSHYADLGMTLTDIFQFKVDGGDGTTTVWFDNWYFYNTEPVYTAPDLPAPGPTLPGEEVFSIFSSAYTNLAETNFNPDWGQSTVVSEEIIASIPTLMYSNLNYQGTNLGGFDGVDQDLSGYEYLHVDMWLAGPADLNFFLISRDSGEQAYQLPNHYGEWLSLDIPLSHYTGLGLSLTDIFQFKVDGGDGSTTVWFDNWYFHNDGHVEPTLDIAGTWVLAPEAGALMVGPNPNDGSWWSSSADDVNLRACFFDDQYVFNEDGTFMNIQDGQTWLEAWQGMDPEGCGTPVAPHDGSNAATWDVDDMAGTLTLNGVGAYLGLAKVFEGGELTDPANAPASITYMASLSDNDETLTVIANIGSGYWTFKLVDINSVVEPGNDIVGTWVLAPIAGALMVGPNPMDGSWWSSSAEDVDLRACFFDDEYVFNEDGSFQNIMDDQTWLEAWQGMDPEGCGTPVAPHDGSNPATWVTDEEAMTLTLNGVGAYLGLAKVIPGGELTDPADAPESVTYDISYSEDGETMYVVGNIGSGYWTFTLMDINAVVDPGTYPTIAAPTPMHNEADVMSIFSDAYLNMEGTNFNPDWGQSTMVTEELIEGNNTLKYGNLNYQGTNLGGADGVDQDLSAYDFLHMDMFLSGNAELNFFLISRDGNEQAFQLPNHYGEWISLDIPLTHFIDLGLDITNIFQFKLDGGDGATTIWFDNWYFYSESAAGPIDVAGTWVMAPEAGALMVGPNPYDGSWWSSSADDVSLRACYFDDQYKFNEDGSFELIMDGATWVEGWQGMDPEGCGTPVAPHDGSNAATWTVDDDAGTITLNGVGAFLGLAKVFNGGELTDPANAPASITYDAVMSDENETLTVLINIGSGYWTFKLVKFDPVSVDTQVIPDDFALSQNYPNPFNPSTMIEYAVVEQSQVSLKVFNITGQEVATLVEGMATPGFYSVSFDASNLAAGTYFYALTAGNQRSVKKMVLIK